MSMELLVGVFTCIRGKRDEVKPPRISDFVEAEFLGDTWKNPLVDYPVVAVLHASLG